MRSLKLLLIAMFVFVSAVVFNTTALAGPDATVSAPTLSEQELADHANNLTFTKDIGNGVKAVYYTWHKPAIVYSVSFLEGQTYNGYRELMILSPKDRSKGTLRLSAASKIISIGKLVKTKCQLEAGNFLYTYSVPTVIHDSKEKDTQANDLKFSVMLTNLWHSTGIYDIIRTTNADFKSNWHLGAGRLIMMFVGIVLLYLAIFKGFEPLLLVPIGFGAILANIPMAGIDGPDGLLGMVYYVGIKTGVFPLIIFMGVGAMTDFGPLIANPKTALLGAAAQFGIFGALIGAVLLTNVGWVEFTLKEAASIGIIGGADGPTSIYLTSKLAPHLLGAIAVAAYSYMALVPIIQPPIMKLFTTKEQRKVKMTQLRHVSKVEKICFPVAVTLLCAFLLPDAAPLIGMLMFGNLMKECGVVERLSNTASNDLINIVTIFLGLSVGSKLNAAAFLNFQTLGILVLGLAAFCVGTGTGVIFGQVMWFLSGKKINPLIGAAGVSAVPMAARVVNKVGLEDNPQNFLLMHAMGPNVAGVIGSAVAAGILLNALT
ncbi:sodium ion-translocating decarboxylase subunit beta [Lentisphaerota bacterium WC36G]|nr:sodium ion-translocating decarboxylase subunit beta [Lentisphaerae bacterium WC36]